MGSLTGKTEKKVRQTSSSPKSQEARARILDAAAEVFAEKGYALGRLADIAAKLDSHVGGLYHYFGSREEIVRAMLEESTHRGGARLVKRLEKLPSDATPIDKLGIAIDEHFRNLDSGDSYVAAWHRVIDQVPPEIAADHRRHSIDNYTRLFREIVSEGQAQGIFSTDLNSDVTHLLMMGALNHARTWYPGKKLPGRAAVVKATLEMFVRALSVPAKS